MCCAQVRGLFPLFSQLKAKDWGYLRELIPDQHAHKHSMKGLHMWAALSLEWQLGESSVAGADCTLVCYRNQPCLSAGATLDSSEKTLQSHVQWFYWKRLSYKPVTDRGRGASAHWNQHVPGCTALNENYCRSQWFDADLILCMITENDVSENGHQGYGMCCYGEAPDDKVKYVYRHRDMYYS